jgi:ribosomal protein L11 methyltransferase
MSAEWIDVTIASTVDAGELLGLLDDPSIQGAWQDTSVIHLYWPEPEWSPEHLRRVEAALRQLDAPQAAAPGIHVQSLPHRDWNRVWAESVKPLRVGRRVIIRPSWEPVVLRPDEIEIILDPKQAFGTGHHATTGLLLGWLEDLVRGGESVLDVGTGSGILAMAALRLGAAHALGIDDDPVAIDCAQEYARVNGFGDELALECRSLGSEGAADLVLANLDRRTLLQLAGRLAGCAETRLLVSGLLAEQREEIIGAFAAAGLYAGEQRERDGWLAMEFVRAQSCEGT